MNRFHRPRSRVKSPDELQILLADLTQRQQEIIERARSENYLFVVYFTAVGAIVAAVVVFLSHPQSAAPVYLPTLVLMGALVLLCLPVDLIHLGSLTELSRVYIQTRLHPRLRELAGSVSTVDMRGEHRVFTYEEFDRAEHRGAFDFVIGVRSAFMSLPAALLLVIYGFLRLQNWSSFGLPFTVTDSLIGAAFITVVIAIIRAFRKIVILTAVAQAETTTSATTIG